MKNTKNTQSSERGAIMVEAAIGASLLVLVLFSAVFLLHTKIQNKADIAAMGAGKVVPCGPGSNLTSQECF